MVLNFTHEKIHSNFASDPFDGGFDVRAKVNRNSCKLMNPSLSVSMVVLCQKHSLLHQLTQNLMTDCYLNYKFNYREWRSRYHCYRESAAQLDAQIANFPPLLASSVPQIESQTMRHGWINLVM